MFGDQDNKYGVKYCLRLTGHVLIFLEAKNKQTNCPVFNSFLADHCILLNLSENVANLSMELFVVLVVFLLARPLSETAIEGILWFLSVY